jgi:hypothetical protein
MSWLVWLSIAAVRNSWHGFFAGIGEEVRIDAAMKEKMVRVLFLFNQRGIRNVVLGSFGAGVFR